MTVTVVCDVLGKANNGTTLAAYNLINSLKEKGHDVRVICSDEDKRGLPGFFVVDPMDFGIFNGYMEKNGVVPAKNDPSVLNEAIDGADVIHVIVPFSLGHAAALAAKERGIPLSAGFHAQAENITSHLHMMDFKPANKLTYRVFYNRLYKYCDCIHYPTQFICDVFEKEVGPTNHYVISNGVGDDFRPMETPKPDEFKDKFVILFTGRYSREKSHDVLIRAAAASKHANEIQLIFAGDGPLRTEIEKLSERLLPNKPVFGFHDHGELLDIINYSDLYVHPAKVEIEAIACLEAIACGRVPVISDSKKSATKYFALDDKNLFKCGNPRDLAKKIDYWIDHPKERENRSREYAGYAEQFRFDACMDAMEKMLLDQIGKK